jgi:hypothetical protein
MAPNGTINGSATSSASVGGTGYVFNVAPGFDYFPVRNLSVGASVLVGYAHVASSGSFLGETRWALGATAQLGFNFWLGQRLSLWPRVFVGFEQIRTTLFTPTIVTAGQVPTSGTALSVGSIVAVEAYAPLLVHLGGHFFVGFGPSIMTDLHNSTGINGAPSHPTTVGASTTISGWF